MKSIVIILLAACASTTASSPDASVASCGVGQPVTVPGGDVVDCALPSGDAGLCVQFAYPGRASSIAPAQALPMCFAPCDASGECAVDAYRHTLAVTTGTICWCE